MCKRGRQDGAYQSRGVGAIETEHSNGGLALGRSGGGSGKGSHRRGAQSHGALGSSGTDGTEDLSREHGEDVDGGGEMEFDGRG